MGDEKRWGWWAGGPGDVDNEGIYRCGPRATLAAVLEDALRDGDLEQEDVPEPERVIMVIEAVVRQPDQDEDDCPEVLWFAETRNKREISYAEARAIIASSSAGD